MQMQPSKKYSGFSGAITRLFFSVLCLTLFCAPSMSTNAFAQGAIDWRLENPFRLFTKAEHTEFHRQEWAQLTPSEKEAPILSAEQNIARRIPFGWSTAMFKDTCWNNTTYSYKHCNGKKPYINPTHHRIVASFLSDEIMDQTCQWRVFPKRRLKNTSDIILSTTAPCYKSVKLDIPYPHGARVRVSPTGMAPKDIHIKVKDLFIVGLGDSFASGEGNPDNPATLSSKRAANYGLDGRKKPLEGYPTRSGAWRKIGDPIFSKSAAGWLSKSCHRSLYSYQTRTALQLAIEQPKRAITYISYACAGSEIPLGLFKRYAGTDWDKQYPFFPQISSVGNDQCGEGHAAVEKDYLSAYSQMGRVKDLDTLVLHECPDKKKRKIDLLMLSIGGNDVGFARLVANAVVRNKSQLSKLGGWAAGKYKIDMAETKLKELKHRYKALKKGIHYLLGVPWRESDRVILTAYPPMVYQEDGKTYCDGSRNTMSVYDQFGVEKEQLVAGTKFAEKLNGFMRKSAQRFGWRFADEHRQQFKPHGFCAKNLASNNLLAEELDFPFKNENGWEPYPPNFYEPYAPRQRWFRTPNDSYLTTHSHASGSIIRKILRSKRLAWFQVLFAATYGGAFHPTSEGHAAMADATLKHAHSVLKKYGQ